MIPVRRKLLKSLGAALPLLTAAGGGLLRAGQAFAATWNKSGFESKAAADAMKSIGATGARIMTTMLHELERTGGRYGLQTMCEGGGQANVTIIERL